MVINTLLIRLKERDEASIQKAVDILKKLKGNVPVLLDSRVEVDVRHAENGYDIMLVNTFNSVDDIPVYVDDPGHAEAGAYVREVMDASASLCYEV